MRHTLLCIGVLGIGCAASRSAPEPVASPPTTTAVETAAEFALKTYVDESTRTLGVVCLQLDGNDDPAKVLDRLTPLARRVSVDRNDCLGREGPTAILSIGAPQMAGDRARLDVGVVLGSAGMVELERRDGVWLVVRVTSPWISLR